VISHPVTRGLGAAVRSGIEHARRSGVRAAVYIDGDGEYDPAQLPALLEPVATGGADYVLGSRFLGERDGMAGHRAATNRALSALMAALTGVPTTDAQTGFRALSAPALAAARIRHDYNCAQVLTLSLWGAGIAHVEVPIRYRRRADGRSFVRHGEYLARVGPALAAEYAQARRARRRARLTGAARDRR
jgi:glycosyltransferase involved in cell wall biosynthesis